MLKIFGDLDYIDQTGHGVPLILKNYGKEAFYISEHTVIVTIPINKELLERNDESNGFDLSDSELKIFSLINKNNNYKMNDFIKESNYSEAYINKILRSLKDKKYIERIGANKNGYWHVLK